MQIENLKWIRETVCINISDGENSKVEIHVGSNKRESTRERERASKCKRVVLLERSNSVACHKLGHHRRHRRRRLFRLTSHSWGVLLFKCATNIHDTSWYIQVYIANSNIAYTHSHSHCMAFYGFLISFVIVISTFCHFTFSYHFSLRRKMFRSLATWCASALFLCVCWFWSVMSHLFFLDKFLQLCSQSTYTELAL